MVPNNFFLCSSSALKQRFTFTLPHATNLYNLLDIAKVSSTCLPLRSVDVMNTNQVHTELAAFYSSQQPVE